MQCKKVRYAEREQAENVLAKALISINIRRREKRIYECPYCQGYHLTSKPEKTA